MSFFQLSTGETAKSTGVMEMSGNMEPIPNNTNVLASIIEAKIETYNEESSIKLSWTVLAPNEYKNRRIFQKVRVYDADPSKRDKHIQMLASIDANCGGKLVASGREPTDQLLTQCLLNHPMVLKLGVWEMDDKKGNWVQAVSPRKQTGAAQQQPPAQPQQQAAPNLDMDDSIPF